MSNHWGLAIGINQYEHFQPLIYAQRDAQAMWGYWVEEAGFSNNHAALLTDNLPTFEQSATNPTKEGILNAVNRVCGLMQPNDFLWVFFSGYGIRFEGHDYLMPVEGNPAVPSVTGVRVAALFEAFRAAASRNIVLSLDMNRSQGAISQEGAGQETIELAQQAGVPLLLSTSPQSFSHETLALRQGLFTATLLEGLRYYGCSTLGQLVQFTNSRLPELSEHHWRPQQVPVSVIPDGQQYLLLQPTKAEVPVGVAPLPSYPIVPPPTVPNRPSHPDHSNNGNGSGNGIVPPIAPRPPENGHQPTTPPTQPSVPEPSVDPEKNKDDLFWQRWQKWGAALIGTLLLGVLLNNYDAFNTGPAPSPEGNSNPGEGSPQSNRPGFWWAIDPNNGSGQAGNEGANGNSQQSDATNAGATGSNALAELPPPLQNAFRQKDYVAALQLLEALPAAERPATYEKWLQQASRGVLDEAIVSISRTRALSQNNQASDYNTAMQLASQIKPQQPLYQEAQQYIDRWSVTVLELAKSRAIQPNQGSNLVAARNYKSAIEAAQLVPDSRTQLHSQAQQYIDRWSKSMLNMAQTRANEGRMDVAVKAAELIPANTPAYTEAQKALQQWQQR